MSFHRLLEGAAMRGVLIRLAAVSCAAAGGVMSAADGLAQSDNRVAAFAFNQRLSPGVNLGNALEAPKEGEWGLTLEAAYFERIEEAGFRSVRIPIKWSAHADEAPPYRIDPEFFQRVDWAVEQATSRGLAAIVNVHHYDEMMKVPQEHRVRFVALWRQISEHYRDAPESVAFELLNEPNGKLRLGLWNELLQEGLTAVRESNPRRIVIVGGGNWNDVEHLEALRLPADDRHLIATFHFYDPFKFTHQGAEWNEDAAEWLGTKWTGSEKERREITDVLDEAARWGKRENRPLFLGEFGAYGKGDMESRARWTRFVRTQAEDRGFSWAYWEFGAGFGVFDRERGEWRGALLEALVEE